MEPVTEESRKETAENLLAHSSNNEKSPTPPPQDPPKKSKKEDRNRKDDKNVEQFMKSLNSLPSLEEKFSLVCKKYVQIADDNKKLQFYIKQSDRRHEMLMKEKEHLQHEFNKTILLKSKLENLCRELQKQNKAIKEESLLKIREEEERRKETQAKFQNTLSEITTLLQQNNEKNTKLRDDNISMSEKFKSVVQQYQLRDQQVEKMAKQMLLESQLSDAKLQKANLEHQAEKERLLAEMEQLKVVAAQYRVKIMELKGMETALKSQLALYTDKYNEFETALVKSNQAFGGYKEHVDMMSKKIKKLEKESLSWKKRWETSQSALLDMCGERQASEERVAATGRQLHHMQSLCRTLQAERSVLLTTLKENNIERPPLPVPAPAPPAPAPAIPANVSAPSSNNKVDAMAANCAQLRQSLAHLQSQLNVLTNKNGTKEEPPKQEKQKKSKSKKSKAEKQAQKNQKEIIEAIKESESDESNATKENSNEKEPNTTETKDQNETTANENVVQNENVADTLEEKMDEKTMENLIMKAINLANVNISDLQVVNDEVNIQVGIENDLVIKELIEDDTNQVPIPESNQVPEADESKLTDAISHFLKSSPIPVSNQEKVPETDESKLTDKVSHILEPSPIPESNQEKVPEADEPKLTDEVSQILELNPNEELSHIVDKKSISKEVP